MVQQPQRCDIKLAHCAGLALLFLFAPVPAQAQVNRCTTSDGLTLYTDRRCTDLDAVKSLQHQGHDGSGRLYRHGCARNVQDLMHEVTSAIDSGDVNRLAGVYHWAGMSGRAGYAVMSQLGAVVQRPLIDIVPIGAAGSDSDDGWQYPRTVHNPIGLRVEQTLANTSTPSRTIFGMHQHFGCYWIKG